MGYPTRLGAALAWSSVAVVCLLVACSRGPASKFEGEWALDIDDMMRQVEAKMAGKVDQGSLIELRANLEKERPHLSIKANVVTTKLRTGSAAIATRIVETMDNCSVVALQHSVKVKYCLKDSDTLVQEKLERTDNDISEIWRRVGN